MEWFLLISGLLLILTGITLRWGLGWASLILDLIAGGNVSDYQDFQKTFKGAKKENKKTIGILSLIVGIVLLGTGISMF